MEGPATAQFVEVTSSIRKESDITMATDTEPCMRSLAGTPTADSNRTSAYSGWTIDVLRDEVRRRCGSQAAGLLLLFLERGELAQYLEADDFNARLPEFQGTVFLFAPGRRLVLREYQLGCLVQRGSFCPAWTAAGQAHACALAAGKDGVIFKISVKSARHRRLMAPPAFQSTGSEVVLSPMHQFMVTSAPYEDADLGWCIDLVEQRLPLREPGSLDVGLWSGRFPECVQLSVAVGEEGCLTLVPVGPDESVDWGTYLLHREAPRPDIQA